MREPGRVAATKRYRSYLLFVLATIYLCNNLDRTVLGLALQNIKATFKVSDTDLGVLGGIAFAVFYSTLGLPIGRWADRGNRVTIIWLSTVIWSFMVMLSGAARTFGQLLLIRIGAAIGEAGCLPPAYSLIADHFPRTERPRALASYFLGGSLSLMVGYFLGGWINELYGWRVMFIALSIPGLALGAIAWVSLREPRLANGDPSDPKRCGSREPGIWEVTRALRRNATFRYVLGMLCANYFFGYGTGQWQAAFFMRSYGMNSGEVGTWFAAVYGLASVLGTYCGGWMATRYAPGNEPLQLRAMGVANVVFAFVSALIYISGDPYVAFVLIGISTVGIALQNGPLFATAQAVVQERMRGVSVSFVFLCANLIGMGLGPLAVGALSDVLRPWAGEESLRYALLAMCPGYWWGGWLLWKAARTVVGDTAVAVRGGGLKDHEKALVSQ